MSGQRECSGGRPGHPVGPPGVVLVITLLLVGLMMIMSTTMINLSSSDYLVATNESRSIQALFNADAGTEEAKMRVSPNAPTTVAIPIGTSADWRAYILSGTTQAQVQGGLDPTYGKVAPNYTTSESTSNYAFYNTVQTGPGAIKWGWARIEQLKDVGGNIVYQDAVTGKATTVASTMVAGVTVNNQPMLVVTAEGIQGAVRRMISPNYRPIVSPPPFKKAIHAKNKVELVGNAWTDSYDSKYCAYNCVYKDALGNNVINKGKKGHASTDSIAPGAIFLETNSTIDGDALIGPGGNPAVAIVNNGTISGQQTNEPAVQDLSLSNIPASCANQGPLTIAGNSTRTLTTGCYWFSSISITGNGQLTIDGAVTIYVTGNIDVGGNGILNTYKLPPNLLIYGGQDTKIVKIHGNGDFYGAVYAPEADINVYGNGATFGALTGKTAKINGNGGFHYDEDLGNLGGTLLGFTRYSWREVAF